MRRAIHITTVVLVLLPVLTLVILSLVSQWSFPNLLGNASFENWTTTLGSGEGMLASFGLSLFISSFIALTATAAGFYFSRQIMYHPRKGRLLPLAYYPYLVAPVVLGIVWQYYFLRAGLSGSLGGVLLAQFLFAFPYSVLLFSGFWGNDTRNLENQAETLGATKWQVTKKVLIPSAKEWIFVSLFQTFLLSWFEYGLTQVISIGKVPTLTVRTMQYVKEANPHFAAVAACLMVFPLLILLLVNRSVFARNVLNRD